MANLRAINFDFQLMLSSPFFYGAQFELSSKRKNDARKKKFVMRKNGKKFTENLSKFEILFIAMSDSILSTWSELMLISHPRMRWQSNEKGKMYKKNFELFLLFYIAAANTGTNNQFIFYSEQFFFFLSHLLYRKRHIAASC